MMRKKVVINGYEYWVEKTKEKKRDIIMFFDTETSKYGISINDPAWTKDELNQIKNLDI